jgi:hypothetical protein
MFIFHTKPMDDITEILLKVALNTINPTLIHKTNYIPLIFCDEIF